VLWDWDGMLERLHHTLYVATREREGREASSTAAIIDSQSAKAAQKGAPRSIRKALMRAKKVTGRKRHVLVDTLGLLLNVVVYPADVQDRDGARLVLDRRTRRLFPFIERIFADAGYKEPRRPQPSPKPLAGSWRSSNATSRIASLFCPSAGLSSARSHGSATIVALRATSSATRDPPPPSFASP
jgi:hypothetical protein